MTKPTHPTKQDQPKPAAKMRTWYMELVLGGVAAGVVFLTISLALDTGSLVAYAIGIAFLLISARHLYNAGRVYIQGKAHDREQ